MKFTLSLYMASLYKWGSLLLLLLHLQSCVVYQLYPVVVRVPTEDTINKLKIHADLLSLGAQFSTDYRVNKNLNLGARVIGKMSNGILPGKWDSLNTTLLTTGTIGIQFTSAYVKEIFPQHHLSVIAGY